MPGDSPSNLTVISRRRARVKKGIVYGMGAIIGVDLYLDGCWRDLVPALFNFWRTLGEIDARGFSGGGFASVWSRGGCCFDSCFIVYGGGHIVSSRTAAELGALDGLYSASDTGFERSVKLDDSI